MGSSKKKKEKKMTFKSKRIKVNQVRKIHVTLEEILGSPAGPVQEPSLGSGATVPVVHSILSCLGNQLSQKSHGFPRAVSIVLYNCSGTAGGGRGEGRPTRRHGRDPEKNGWRKGSLLCSLETCLSSSCKSGVAHTPNPTLLQFFKKSFTVDIS